MIGGAPWWRPGDVRPARLPVIDLAAEALSLRAEDILSRASKKQEQVRGRALVVWALRAIPSKPVSYTVIGRVLGGIHHTSASDLHMKAIGLRLRDRQFAGACNALLGHFHLREEDIHASH